MEQKPPSFVPPKVAAVLGVLAVAASAAIPIIPPVAQPYVGLGAFVLAFFAGVALPQIKLTAGKPVLSGTALTAVTGAGVFVEQLGRALPETYQPLAYAGAALLAILAGKTVPAFGPAQQAGVEASKQPGSGVDA